MKNTIDTYGEILLSLLPKEGGKELLLAACRRVDPHEPPPEIPSKLASILVGTPLETLPGKNDFLFGLICGKALSLIQREEGA